MFSCIFIRVLLSGCRNNLIPWLEKSFAWLVYSDYMKIILAPNAFKGSLTAAEAARAMAAGVRRVVPGADIVEMPVADGGDGLLEVAAGVVGGRRAKCLVSGPLGELVEAEFIFVAERALAVIEMAQAGGLVLLPPGKRNPLKASTFGLGELVLAALDLDVRKIIIGIGGSATNDGGAGMARALGARLLAADGHELAGCGADLAALEKIDLTAIDARLSGVEIIAACDVDNPLHGPHGAAYVYAPQKGASKEQIEILDQGLRNLARVIKRDLGLVVDEMPGAGAAGGLGAGIYAFLGGKLRRGSEVVLEMLDFAGQLRDADLVLTGEGRLDGQTVRGKAPAAVAAAARDAGVPCLALAGALEGEGEIFYEAGFTARFSLAPGPRREAEALPQTATDLIRTSEQLLQVFLAKERSAVRRLVNT